MRVLIEYTDCGKIDSITFEQSSGYDPLLADKIFLKIIEKTVSDNFTRIKNECLYEQGIITKQELDGEINESRM